MFKRLYRLSILQIILKTLLFFAILIPSYDHPYYYSGGDLVHCGIL